MSHYVDIAQYLLDTRFIYKYNFIASVCFFIMPAAYGYLANKRRNFFGSKIS